LQGGRMVTLVLAFGMFGQLAGGWVADLSVRRLGLRWGRVLPMSLSGLVAGAAYVVCLQLDSAWGVVACCCVVSFAVDMGNPAIWAFMQDVGGRATAAAFGWGNMWGNFGASAISMLVPYMLELGKQGGTGQRNVFLLCAGSLFLYSVIVWGIDATRPVLKPEVK
jgi:ACS family glucarate transporter-like MFS transporter